MGDIYTNPPQSRNEAMVEAIINGTEYTDPPQSRNEAILKSIIDDTEYTDPPQSRMEDLLIQLKDASAGGEITLLSVPTYTDSMTYNGTEQTAQFNNYDAEKMTVTGNKATNAGTYTAVFTPNKGCYWNNGDGTATNEPKSVSWSIAKATNTITASPSTISLDTTTLYQDVTITQTGVGTLSVVSGDTSVATVGELSGGVVRVTGIDNGTTTITVSATATENYEAGTLNIPCAVSFISNVLNDNPWSVISAVSAAGEAQNYWSVGDTKAVTLNGTVGTETFTNQTFYAFILGFDHNSAIEGNGISFGCFKTAQTGETDIALTDANYSSKKSDGTKAFNLNHWGGSSTPYNTNYGGWKGCDARYDILGSTDIAPSGYGSAPLNNRTGYDASTTTATSPVANTLMSALPSDLRSVMKPIIKYTDNKGNGSILAANVTSSVDYLPLLAEKEVFGSISYANINEGTYQTQYSYYANNNSKIKYQSRSESSAANWLCRSPRSSYADSFVDVIIIGSADYESSRYSYGLAPTFLV